MSTGNAVSVEVPDIGDFEDVPVIEILVSEGDRVAADDPLVTLESDKATMDVPAPFAGIVKQLSVKIGDKVSQGTPLLTIEPSGNGEVSSTASAVASDGAPTEAAAPDAVGSAIEAEAGGDGGEAGTSHDGGETEIPVDGGQPETAPAAAQAPRAADVWSVTSFTELRREGLEVERWNLLHPTDEPRRPYVAERLAERDGPVVASTDYMRAFSDQIRQWVPSRYRVLGTDGFGRSDSRRALRRFFEVDRHYVVLAALRELADEGDVEPARVQEAIERYEIDPEAPVPTTV